MKIRVQYNSVFGHYVVECKRPGWFKPWLFLRSFDFRGLAEAYLSSLTPETVEKRLTAIQDHDDEEERRRSTKYEEREI